MENGLDVAQVSDGSSGVGHGSPLSEPDVSVMGISGCIHDCWMEGGERGVKDKSKARSCMQAPGTESANVAETRLGGSFQPSYI